MPAVVHDFRERLAWSNDLSDEAAWVAVYRALWPDLVCAVRIDGDCAHQRHGVDRVVYLPNGREIKIDEKKRDTDFGDFLCEVGSCDRWDNGPQGRQRIGWTLDATKRCDFIAYAIVPSGVCHLLPFELLRLTARRRVTAWKQGRNAYPKIAPNRGYQTISVAVPWDVLWHDMAETSRRVFDLALALPEQVRVTEGQLSFGWTPT